MIQMSVGKKNRSEFGIRSRWRAIQRFRFLATLKQATIDKNSRLLCLDDITRTGYFAACCASECDFHRDNWLVLLSQLKQGHPLDCPVTNCFPPLAYSPHRGASTRSGNWLSGFVAMGRQQAAPVRPRFRSRVT